jgi:hypothetical protein
VVFECVAARQGPVEIGMLQMSVHADGEAGHDEPGATKKLPTQPHRMHHGTAITMEISGPAVIRSTEEASAFGWWIISGARTAGRI